MGKTQTDKATIDLVINGQQAQSSLKEISLAAIRTRKELNNMREADNPEAYAEKIKQLKALNSAMNDHAAKIRQTETAWERFKKNPLDIAKGVLGGNLATQGLEKLMNLIPQALDSGMALKDQFADIAKATGLSNQQIKELNADLKGLNTRTATEELRNIAVVGGQLGVASEQMLGFVENADKAVVALGDEFSGGVEEVSKSIGGMAKLFDETKDMEIGPAINDIGSALNELGAAGSATAPVVADFTTRMGQLGNLAPQISETMGLGAALQELGLSAEIGAGGLSNILLTAAKDTATFAQQLNLSEQAMKDLINTDPNKFLLQLAESLNGLPTDEQAKALAALGITSQEATKVMSLLASQTDFVRQKQELASKAMAEGTSLTAEFNKKNFDLAVNLKRLKEFFADMLTGDGIQAFTGWLTEAAVRMLGLKSASEAATQEFYRQKTEVESLEKKLPPLLARHDELKSKTALTKAEQEELKSVVSQVASVVPSAVTEFDKYGNALGVNTAKAREFIKTQKALLAYQNRDAIDDSESEVTKLERRQAQLQGKLKSRKESYATTGGMVESTMTNDQIAGYSRELNTVTSQIDTVRARLKGLKGEMMEVPKAAAAAGAATPTGSGSAAKSSGSGGARIQSDEEKRKAEEVKKANQDMLADIQKMKAEAVKDEKTRELAEAVASAERERQRARDSKASAQNKALMLTQIDQKLAFDKNQIEDKYLEKERERQAKLMDLKRKAAEEELQVKLATEKADLAMDLANGKITKEEAKVAELTLERTYLDAKKLLYTAHYEALGELYQKDKEKSEAAAQEKTQSLASIASELLTNQASDSEARGEIVEEEGKREKKEKKDSVEGQKDAFQKKKEIFNASVSVLKGFFKENTLVYKAALVAQQAWALSEVGILYAKSMMKAVESSIGIPFPGNLVAIAKTMAIPTLQAGASIAQIRKQKFDMPQFAAGGYTGKVGISTGMPSGFTDGPTFFAQRGYLAGEAGEEFIVNNRALQNPVVADFARIMDSMQKTGNYSELSYGSGSGSAGGTVAAQADMVGVVAELRALRKDVQQQGKRPVELNYRYFKKQTDYIDEIKSSTSY